MHHNTCDAGTCKFVAIAGCCKGDGGCDDGDDATVDTCANNKCVNSLAGLPTTCKADADCKGTACATGACVGGACSYKKIAGKSCCANDAACASDTACVVDQCLGWVCSSGPAKGAGVHVWGRFDDASLKGWSVSKGNSQAAFHVSDLLVYAARSAAMGHRATVVGRWVPQHRLGDEPGL